MCERRIETILELSEVKIRLKMSENRSTLLFGGFWEVSMAHESVVKYWGSRKDMHEYWSPENHKTKSKKSKGKGHKRAINYYDILARPQKWSLLDAYQNFDPATDTPWKDTSDKCTISNF